MSVETCKNPKVLEPNGGLPPGNQTAPNPSPAPIVREAAGNPSGHRKTGRRGLPAPEVDSLYQLYQSGMSLEDVGLQTGRTRQSVFDIFVRRGLALRPKTFLDFVVYNGEKFTLATNGYYRATATREPGRECLLHRIMWIDANGPIPKGFDVHHKDKNKWRNELENFECLRKSDHTRLHNPLHRLSEKHCKWCGSAMVRNPRSGHLETPFAYSRRKFCNHRCAARWQHGNPRGRTA